MTMRTNRPLKVQRQGADVSGLTGLLAFLWPLQLELVALQDLPAGKAVGIRFRELLTSREQDRIDHEIDSRYRGTPDWAI